jgi:FlaA1/EpsC-like NDP-sugar epimerase
MGEQICVADMARNLIRLSGFVPDEDIEITYVGIRPGEKLYEELVGTDEISEPSVSRQVMRVRPRSVPLDLDRRVSELGRSAVRGATVSLVEQLRAIVPTFQPQSTSPEAESVQITVAAPAPVLDLEPARMGLRPEA